jgi:hypothetical protein
MPSGMLSRVSISPGWIRALKYCGVGRGGGVASGGGWGGVGWGGVAGVVVQAVGCLIAGQSVARMHELRPCLAHACKGSNLCCAHRVQRGLGGAARQDVGDQVGGVGEAEAKREALHVLCSKGGKQAWW